MFSATDLACSRGERTLFAGLSFALAPGDWLQVTGANGAGKTTLMRTLVGLSQADAGQVTWNGRAVQEQADAFRRATLYLGHHAAVKEELNPIENLQLSCALDGEPVAEPQVRTALQTLGLAGRGRLPTRHLSAGQKRRVLLARLLLRPARLWVLDEPFAALDTAAVELIGLLLAAHLQGGGMALLTSHQPVPLAGGGVVAL